MIMIFRLSQKLNQKIMICCKVSDLPFETLLL